MKQIKINNCNDCPYKGSEQKLRGSSCGKFSSFTDICVKRGNSEIKSNIYSEIPEWCPLDDIK